MLNFFGVNLGALRIAGGLVVAVRAWGLLTQPEVHEKRKASSAEPAQNSDDDVAFFPLTMPLTNGPGTIAVVIALSSAPVQRHRYARLLRRHEPRRDLRRALGLLTIDSAEQLFAHGLVKAGIVERGRLCSAL